jgi:hypothetical protein
MAAARSLDAEEKPLDPALARVQARLRAMVLIAGLTLGLGVIAVLLAVIYRIVTLEDNPAGPLAAGAGPAAVDLDGLGLPSGAEVVSTALDGDRLAVTFKAGGEFVILVLDASDMSVISRARIPAP